MRKPVFSICKNKDADQLRSNGTADQHLSFRYIDSTNPLLSNSEISSLLPSSVVAQPGKQFFSHVGTEPPLPGYYQYFWGVNLPCSRSQHCLIRVRLEPPTSGSGVQGINHQATALPHSPVCVGPGRKPGRPVFLCRCSNNSTLPEDGFSNKINVANVW